MPGNELFPPSDGVSGRRSWLVRGGRQGRQGPGVQQGHTLLQDTSDHRLPLRSASSLRTKDNDHQGTSDSVENDMQNRSEVPSRLQSKSASSAFPCLTVTEPAGDGRTGVSASAGHAPCHGGEETRGHRGSGISEGGARRRGDPSWCTGGWGQASWPRARGRGADGRGAVSATAGLRCSRGDSRDEALALRCPFLETESQGP